MQSPILIFDHVNDQVVQIQPGTPGSEKQIAEIASAQRDQVTSSTGRPSS